MLFTPLPLAGGVGVGSQRYAKSFARNRIKGEYIKDVKIRKADFFLYVPQSGTYHVGAADISYEIYRAEGISCALRARGEGAKTSRKREVLLLPSGRQGRRPLEAQGVFRPLRRST